MESLSAFFSFILFFNLQGYIYICINTMYMHVALVHLEKTLMFYYRALRYTLHSRQRKDELYGSLC